MNGFFWENDRLDTDPKWISVVLDRKWYGTGMKPV